MKKYRFVVDRDLNIQAWDSVVEMNGAADFSCLLGKPYYHFVPRIMAEQNDAVELAMETGVPLDFKEYRDYSYFTSERADISIQPIKSEQNGSDSAVITIRLIPADTPDGAGDLDHHFIDIGKKSATLAHGVRTPLNAIKGAVVYLKEKFKDEATFIEFSTIIEEEISKLDGFITKFLSSSMVESEFDKVDINAIIVKIVSMLKYMAYAKKISFSQELSDLRPIMGDSFRLEHAIMNVINNSMEAIQSGGKISLKTGIARRNELEYVVIEVRDTGCGVAIENFSDLSNPSQNINKKDGRGFGLFITREIVQYHGGFLEILSRKKLATMVRILLPVGPS
jgi:two-component system nitrogen regulation sensor histidine kinase GlnL